MPGYGPLPNVPLAIKIVITSVGADTRKAETILHMSYTGSPPTTAVALARPDDFALAALPFGLMGHEDYLQ